MKMRTVQTSGEEVQPLPLPTLPPSSIDTFSLLQYFLPRPPCPAPHCFHTASPLHRHTRGMKTRRWGERKEGGGDTCLTWLKLKEALMIKSNKAFEVRWSCLQRGYGPGAQGGEKREQSRACTTLRLIYISRNTAASGGRGREHEIMGCIDCEVPAAVSVGRGGERRSAR